MQIVLCTILSLKSELDLPVKDQNIDVFIKNFCDATQPSYFNYQDNFIKYQVKMCNNYPRCNVITIIWTCRQSAPSPADDQVLLKITIETTRLYFMKNACGDQII